MQRRVGRSLEPPELTTHLERSGSAPTLATASGRLSAILGGSFPSPLRGHHLANPQ
jgi:hypothetical protein